MTDPVKFYLGCSLITMQNMVVSDTLRVHVGGPKIWGRGTLGPPTLDGAWLFP